MRPDKLTALIAQGRSVASYVAIDFETANETRASACAVGVVRVDDANITSYWTTLIDPEVPFAPMNIFIHGIDSEAVSGAPTFPSVLERILETADGAEVLVAHSASFDMQVLATSVARYGNTLEPQSFACTRVFARRWFPGWPSYSLRYVVDELGIVDELGADLHHVALWDAGAAMLIAEHGLQRNGFDTWQEAADAAAVHLGTVTLSSYSGCVSKTSKINPSRRPDAEMDPDHPLFSVAICFTGALERYTRREAAQVVVDAGGRFQDSVTKATDLLVVGKQDLAKLKGREQSSKMRRAAKMAATGHHIEIVDEADFYRMLAR